MNKGQVSIIIPFFNSAQFIDETLQSIANQTYLNWECICVDDGSTDSSADIVKSWSIKDDRFKLINRPSHYPKGGNSCRNYGFEESTGEHVQWFDSDDIMHESMLVRKIEVLQNNPHLNYVICETGFFSGNTCNVGRYEQNLNSNKLYVDYLSFNTKFFTPGPMFRKDFLIGMKLFDFTLKRHQEKEFFFRVILKDNQYGVISEALVLRRIHQSSLSGIADASKRKTEISFLADQLMFGSYRESHVREKGVALFFRQKFLRYGLAFAKKFLPIKVVKSIYYYAIASLMYMKSAYR